MRTPGEALAHKDGFFDRHSVQFPAWLKRGPWPYEAGITMLLLWMIECIRNNYIQVARYVDQPILFAAVGKYATLSIAVILAAALCLVVGLTLVVAGRLCSARWWRVAGLGLASFIFGFVAVGFHATWAYSFGGGAYLLLTWRTFCVAVRLGQESGEDA